MQKKGIDLFKQYGYTGPLGTVSPTGLKTTVGSYDLLGNQVNLFSIPLINTPMDISHYLPPQDGLIGPGITFAVPTQNNSDTGTAPGSNQPTSSPSNTVSSPVVTAPGGIVEDSVKEIINSINPGNGTVSTGDIEAASNKTSLFLLAAGLAAYLLLKRN